MFAQVQQAKVAEPGSRRTFKPPDLHETRGGAVGLGLHLRRRLLDHSVQLLVWAQRTLLALPHILLVIAEGLE